MVESKEPVYHQEINDYIHQQGIDKALAIYTKDEVEHHLGGKHYGAKVVEGSHVIEVRHLVNTLGATWEQVEPLLEPYKQIKTQEVAGVVLTDATMVLQIKKLWFWYTSGPIKRAFDTAWASKIKAEFYTLKTQPLNEALANIPFDITDSELIGQGFTSSEALGVRQATNQTGFTMREILYGNLAGMLVMCELNKIGLIEAGVSHDYFDAVPKA